MVGNSRLLYAAVAFWLSLPVLHIFQKYPFINNLQKTWDPEVEAGAFELAAHEDEVEEDGVQDEDVEKSQADGAQIVALTELV
jgi:hypothetical protein